MPRGPLAIVTRGRLGPFRGGRRLFGVAIGSASNGSVLVRTWPSLAATPQRVTEGQETPKKWLALVPSTPGNGSTLVNVQAPVPPVGSVEVRTSPLLSTTTQCVAETQAAPVICTEPPPATVFQLGGAPNGLAEVIRLPPVLPDTQSGPKHETPNRFPFPTAGTTWAHEAGPLVGLVEARIRPSLPTATQNDGDAHETPRSSSDGANWVVAQAALPPVGFVEVMILPPPAAATQSAVVGQETA